MTSADENYVRPPIVAQEAPNPRVGVWRYRITLFVLLAIIAVGIFLIVKSIVGSGEGNPDVSGTLRQRPGITEVHR
jgi:hypothetical protein